MVNRNYKSIREDVLDDEVRRQNSLIKELQNENRELRNKVTEYENVIASHINRLDIYIADVEGR